jgi:hypothetical protein
MKQKNLNVNSGITVLQGGEDVKDVPVNFHFPKIGSVRGGGSWDVVSQIIKHRLNRNQYTLNLWEIN